MRSALVLATLFCAACGSGSEPPISDASNVIDRDAGTIINDGGHRPDDVPVFYVRASSSTGSGTEADPFGDLATAINTVPSPAKLVVFAGTYTATPAEAMEPQTRVQYRYGFAIRGKTLSIEGVDRAAVRIETRAGYGVLIEDGDVSIERVTIAAGIRDAAEEATSGAIVARSSVVRVRDVKIGPNNSLRPGNAYPGISGIVGREGARLEISAVTIEENRWDGVALYRGARATVVNCSISNGDGIGLSAREDAELLAVNNQISGYWRGIAGFDQSAVVAKNNQLVDLTGAGAWAGGGPDSLFDLINNVVAGAGNCGLTIELEAKGRAINNVIAFGGADAVWLCPQAGIWSRGEIGRRFHLGYNLIWAHNSAVWRGGDTAGGGVAADNEVIGQSGNIASDPLFTAVRDFRLSASSPAINAGDPAIMDRDGTRSDLGYLGGPDAERMDP